VNKLLYACLFFMQVQMVSCLQFKKIGRVGESVTVALIDPETGCAYPKVVRILSVNQDGTHYFVFIPNLPEFESLTDESCVSLKQSIATTTELSKIFPCLDKKSDSSKPLFDLLTNIAILLNHTGFIHFDDQALLPSVMIRR
jgi:hypothetical protein